MHKAFNSIVKIADARALWEKIKDDASVVGAVSDGADIGAETEEVEDSMGNVFTRRAYEELRRQGIISS
jgi:splicing factor 3A subunit 3